MSPKSTFLLALSFVGILAIPQVSIPGRTYGDSRPAITDELIQNINSQESTWTAGHNNKFDGMTIGQAKSLLGSILGGPKPVVKNPVYDPKTLPASFDARDAWPNCPSVSLVRDQSACGSCWAFGSTEAFNDRYCIATQKTTIFSVTDVLGCCELTCGDGCDGGYPQMAWSYFKRYGVVTDSCYPYPFPACAHHVVSPNYPPCPSSDYSTPKCNKTCADGSDFSTDKIKATSTYGVTGEQNIMAELTKGPVTAAYTVYEDFLAYKSGVYQHLSGSELGGHAVEIIGYGTENGVKYWTVRNSWNPSWGDGGYFKILRGSDECGIEDEIVTGTA
jgi:cathepsin B